MGLKRSYEQEHSDVAGTANRTVVERWTGAMEGVSRVFCGGETGLVECFNSFVSPRPTS